MFGKDRLAHPAQKRGEFDRQNKTDGITIDLLDRKGLVVDGKDIPRGTGDGRIINKIIEGEDHIIRRERFSIVPADILTQVKRPGQAIFADVPGLCQVGFDLCGKSVGGG